MYESEPVLRLGRNAPRLRFSDQILAGIDKRYLSVVLLICKGTPRHDMILRLQSRGMNCIHQKTQQPDRLLRWVWRSPPSMRVGSRNQCRIVGHIVAIFVLLVVQLAFEFALVLYDQ